MSDESPPQPPPVQVPAPVALVLNLIGSLITTTDIAAQMSGAHPLELLTVAVSNLVEAVCSRIPLALDVAGVLPNLMKCREALLSARTTLRAALDQRVQVVDATARVNGKRVV